MEKLNSLNNINKEESLLSKLFNQACETARREFVAANKMYRKSKTILYRDAMISNRRSYRLAKRKAKDEYNNEQKRDYII